MDSDGLTDWRNMFYYVKKGPLKTREKYFQKSAKPFFFKWCSSMEQSRIEFSFLEPGVNFCGFQQQSWLYVFLNISYLTGILHAVAWHRVNASKENKMYSCKKILCFLFNSLSVTWVTYLFIICSKGTTAAYNCLIVMTYLRTAKITIIFFIITNKNRLLQEFNHGLLGWLDG